MITLAFLLLGLALVAAQAYATAARPLPVAEAIPLTALGLAWRRDRELKTRYGDRVLWIGLGDPATYRRAYNVARTALRDAGYSWTDDRTEAREGVLTPCCWEPVPADEAAAAAAISAAEAAIVADDEGKARVQAYLREREIKEAEANGPGREADIEAMRVSLDKLFWAWPTKKRALADALLKEPLGVGGYPTIGVAKVARTLVRQVDEAIEKVRGRLARDPSHDWLARAQVQGVPEAVHEAVKLITSHDEDRASVENGVGWGKAHSHAGHILASLPVLSVIEATSALAAVHRHRRQLPPALREACFGSAEA
ncbi:hypothetical protein [Methylobacterium sp. Leaf117]|uniref:hypothetical protein n=1 Tax=Methylobacterium sp. Leaf117 TaxID=1736260 RepID=UPI0006FDFCC3|nr:hypothetical protein [Methylobacterium sp. Leaf117]KQP79203.1 hypothetical protein ASF57_18540 [Methylobacterium sp. Leaf117]